MKPFAKRRPGGYTMVALNSIAKMERQQKGASEDAPVPPAGEGHQVLSRGAIDRRRASGV